MTDWIASNERYFPYIRLEDQPEALDYKSRIGDAWEELSLPYPWEPGNIWMFTPLYKQRFGFNTPNNMQTAVEEVARDVVSPGILVLEAPMGSGKTEAHLHVLKSSQIKWTVRWFFRPPYPGYLRWVLPV